MQRKKHDSVFAAKRNPGVMVFFVLILLWTSGAAALGNKPHAKIAYDIATLNTSEPWQNLSVDLSRKTAWLGSLTGRINVSRRFGSTATQLEVEAYPEINSFLYSYIGVGYSPFDLFPTTRYGVEIFAGTGGGNEFSLGWRSLQFTTSSVTVYTGSYGKYTGNWWFSLRPYFSFKENRSSISIQLTGRKYFRNADEYLGFTLGWGSSPGESLTASELERQESAKISLTRKKPLSPETIAIWSIYYQNEQLSGNRTQTQIGVTVGYEFTL